MPAKGAKEPDGDERHEKKNGFRGDADASKARPRMPAIMIGFVDHAHDMRKGKVMPTKVDTE